MQQLRLLEDTPRDYRFVDDRQRAMHAEIAAGAHPDTVIYTEFAPVYTAGSRTLVDDLPDDSVPVLRVDRGGSVTYHGPGQLIAYPLIRVAGRQDVVAYVRALEAAAIGVAAHFGVTAQRVVGRTGAWIVRAGEPDRKLCAIGVRFAKHTTMHGLAFNVTTNLADFDRIVPCGIRDAATTSLAELGVTATLGEVTDVLHPLLERELARFQHAVGAAA